MDNTFKPFTVISNSKDSIEIELKGAKLLFSTFTFRILPVLFLLGSVASLFFFRSLKNAPLYVYLAPVALLLIAVLMLAENFMTHFSINSETIHVKRNSLFNSKRKIIINTKDVHAFSFLPWGRRFEINAELTGAKKITVLEIPFLYKNDEGISEIVNLLTTFLKK